MKEKLKKLELICPLHIILIKDGYGEFSDVYKLTEEGIKKLTEIYEKFSFKQR